MYLSGRIKVQVGQVLLPGQGSVDIESSLLIDEDSTLKNNSINYIKSLSRIKLKLPLIPVDDAEIVVMDIKGGLFDIEQRENEIIYVGDVSTTLGITGKIESQNLGDAIKIIRKDGFYRAIILSGYLQVI